jgi:hypothetical protein
MAMSTCAKCGGHSFEVKINEPHDAKFKTAFVQCRSCGVPVGVQDYYNLGSLLKDQEKRIKSLEADVENVAGLLTQVVNALRQRR